MTTTTRIGTLPDRPHIAFLPGGGETAPTARIRYYTTGRGLAELGVSWSIGDESGKADVLFVETWNWRALNVVRRAKARGATILFDLNNPGAGVSRHPVLLEMIRLADTVTTATEPLKEWIREHYGPSRIALFCDAIDYYPTGPVAPQADEAGPLRLFWFGFMGKTAALEKYLPALEALENVQLVVAAAEKDARRFASNPRIEAHTWTLDGFVSIMRSCHLSVLMHDTTKSDSNCTTNHRMITSITWGVPAVVTRTSDYEKTAREFSVEEGLFSTPEELTAAVERLRSPAARARYLKKAQDPVWARYSPKAVATDFLVLAHEAAAARDTSAYPAPNNLAAAAADLAAVVAWKIWYTLSSRRRR